MPSNETILYFLGGVVGLFIIILIAYIMLNKKMQKSEYKQIQKLRKGTKESTFSLEILYQKLYITFLKTPFLKRYLLKLRRRLEIINIDDEYVTRRDSAKILFKTLLILVPIAIATIVITHNNILLMTILLLFELFMIDTIIDRFSR